MSSRIAIFYEDELVAGSKLFPLHLLVVACIADDLEFALKDIEPFLKAYPMKCDSKLLTACKSEPHRMREHHILALFDADQLHRLLGLRGDTPRPTLTSALQSQIPDPRVRVFLLDRNTETLVDATADCLGRERPGIKDKLNRDDFLARAAWDHSRASRDCIREKVPTFASFVDAVIPLVHAALTA